MTEQSFSKSIKADLLKVTDRTKEEMQAELITAFLCAGRPGADKSDLPLFFASSSGAYAERLVGQLRAAGLDALAEKSDKEKSSIWYVYPLPNGNMTFDNQLLLFLEEDMQDKITSSIQARRAALRGAFLASGSMSEPLKAYQIDISVRNSKAADYLTLLLHAENIEPSVFYRNGHPVVYFKEGQVIGDFLALIGAHSSLLRFESIRVDKELRNSVNRVVNCDTANARRQAEACVRQSSLIEDLLESTESVKIPQELIEAAHVRVDNPGMSIRDLGLMMSPPIGKSGMNHRLRKLEEIAKEAGLG